MPTICDLYRVRKGPCRSFAISPAAIASDDSDRGMSGEPGLGCRGLTIWQQGDDPAPFQVADDAGVSVIAPPGPIINADNLKRVSRGTVTASDHAQESILTHRQHQPPREVCCRSTAKRQAEVMNDRVQPRRASRRWCQYPFGEALREDLAPAQNGVAAEASGNYNELDGPPESGRSVTRLR
jgi:hypothetical protein